MSKLSRDGLIIFVKNPVAGKVKTRLAKDIGNEKALRVYEFLLDKIYKETKNLAVEKYLFLSDALDQNLFDSGFTQILQKGKDLGERMANGFDYLFDKGFDKALIIGSDVPELDSKIIYDAFEKLFVYDIVIGPSKDGGYYLIGMKEQMNFLFEDIQWSSEEVLNSTMKKDQNQRENILIC